MFLLAKVEDLAYYQDLAQARNPLLSQVSLKRELAQEGVRAQRADFLPQVAAIGGGSFYNYQVAGLVPRWAVGVGVNIKIFDGLNREYTSTRPPNRPCAAWASCRTRPERTSQCWWRNSTTR